jgi:hypothetical protein
MKGTTGNEGQHEMTRALNRFLVTFKTGKNGDELGPRDYVPTIIFPAR